MQIYSAEGDQCPKPVKTPAVPDDQHWNWNRKEIAEWLITQVESERTFIAGIDHGFSFPESYFLRHYITNWDAFLQDFCKHWPTDESTVKKLKDGNERTGRTDEFRLTEKWTLSAKSVFDLTPKPGIVGYSTHAGIPWLHKIREKCGAKIHFWPFDGWTIPAGRSAIVEAYPSILRRRYPDPPEGRTDHQHDAYLIARWLSKTVSNGFLSRYLDPPLTAQERRMAELEGWILGVA